MFGTEAMKDTLSHDENYQPGTFVVYPSESDHKGLFKLAVKNANGALRKTKIRRTPETDGESLFYIDSKGKSFAKFKRIQDLIRHFK